MAKLVDLDGEWAAAIGRAFVAFGEIEYITVVCLDQLPRDRIQRSTKSFRLGQRIDLLVEIIDDYKGQAYKDLVSKLLEAKELAKTRNIIAHNPLVFNFYEDRNGELSKREAIAHLHSDKCLDLDDVKRFASESEILVSELYRASFEAIQDRRAQAGE